MIDLASDRVFADEELVQALGEFTELSRLRLAVANTIPSAFENLKGLGQLTELLLQGAPLTDLQLAELLQCMPGLERLTLRRLSRVTDQIGPTLMNCRRLRVLALIEMNGISGATLSQLTSHEGLRSLDLRNCGQLTVEDYRLLHQMTHLTELKLGGPAVNDEVISLIASHPALSSLAIEDAEVSGDCLRKLAASPQLAQRLERLAFARCFGITDDALAGLERFPLLKSLTLRSLFVTGSFLALSDEQSQRPLTLETLVVTDGFLTDDVVSEFPARIPDIVRLDLSGNAGITNASLKVFEKLGVLEHLSLDRTGVLADAQKAAQGH